MCRIGKPWWQSGLNRDKLRRAESGGCVVQPCAEGEIIPARTQRPPVVRCGGCHLWIGREAVTDEVMISTLQMVTLKLALNVSDFPKPAFAKGNGARRYPLGRRAGARVTVKIAQLWPYVPSPDLIPEVLSVSRLATYFKATLEYRLTAASVRFGMVGRVF